MTRNRRVVVLSLSGLVLAAAALAALVSAVSTVRGKGQQTECQSRLRMLGLGLVQHATSRGYYPAAVVPNDQLPLDRRLSWFFKTMQYIQSMPEWAVETEPWDSPGNRKWSTRDIWLFHCPSVSGDHPGGLTQFVGITGVGRDSPRLPREHPRAGVFGFDRSARFDELKDVASTTLLIVETAERNGRWLSGGDPTVRPIDPARRPHVGRGRPFGGLHRGGANAVFADGSVRFIPDSVDPKVLEALGTVAGGEAVGPDVARW